MAVAAREIGDLDPARQSVPAGGRSPVVVNLGCGLRYLPQAENLDRHRSPIADRVGPAAVALAGWPTASIDRLVVTHLIEHLPFTEVTTFLLECRRVLIPGGLIDLETPDPAPAFAALVASTSAAQRGRWLAWVFGGDAPGMAHRLLYWPDHLTALLRGAGFAAIRSIEPRARRRPPSYRLLAEATALSRLDRCELQFRRCLTRRYRRHPAWESIAADAEEALATARQCAVGSSALEPSAEDLLARLGVFSSRLATEVAATLADGSPPPAVAERAGDELGSATHTAWDALWREPVAAGRQAARWAAAVAAAEPTPGIVDPVPDPGRASRRSAGPARRTGGLPFGSRIARWLARVELAIGIRRFAEGRLREARRRFSAALRRDCDQSLAWWNLARLATAAGNRSRADACYQSALAVSTPASIADLVAEVRAAVRPDGPVFYRDDC